MPKISDVRTTVCWLFTVIYLALAACWVVPHWHTVWMLDSDKLGNWLAGIFSPLAFLWLVYTALAQRDELKLQRQELSQNNATQLQQQQQMQRQADALDLQTRRLAAQANAAYSPVFTLWTFGQGEDGATWVQIENLGAQVIDVFGGYNVRRLLHIQDESGRTRLITGGVIAANFPRDAKLGLEIDDPTRPFSLEVTRLDLVKVRFGLRLIGNEQRLELLTAEEIV